VEARALALAEGPRPEVILAVVAAAVILMIGPALVAGLSILDSNLLAGIRSWVQEISSWISYLAHARILLTLPIAAMVARATEDR
jgi:hypothetical protein